MGHLGGALNIVRGARSDAFTAQSHFLGNTATVQTANLAEDAGFAVAVAILFRQEHGDSEGPATGNDTDLVDRIMLRHQAADDGMAGFMVGGIQLFLVGHDHGFTLGAHHDLILGFLEFFHGHALLACASSE